MMSKIRSREQTFCVGIPAYNESATIRPLVESLLCDSRISEIFVADDKSTDGTAEIVESLAQSDRRVHLLRGAGRAGQVAGWLMCARATDADTVVFVDADSVPHPGAIARLARACTDNLIVSGRIEPLINVGGAGGRFSAELLHHVRASGNPALAIIGRFFAAKREWFLQVCDRTDIIANDMWLGLMAMRDGHKPRYVANAIVRYVSPNDGGDFAAQRQRADSGVRQLRELGILQKKHLPGGGTVLQGVVRSALSRHGDMPAWIWSQAVARMRRYYTVPKGAHVGIWEPQQSTKRSV